MKRTPAKLNVPLDPSMPADAGLKRILVVLLSAMRANEDGARHDLDPEYLHDFRVAVRRTRSCLSQIKGVLDPKIVDSFRKEFAWLGEVTGPTRDLDVFLRNIVEYRRDMPVSSRPGLDTLLKHLRERQKKEQKRVVSALDSERYRSLVTGWSEFLEDTGESRVAPNAARPIRDVAAMRVAKAFRRVRKRVRGLDGDTSAEVLHVLRIDCKKLRYLLEFFRNAFEPKRVNRFVRTLKRLQDGLGELNDLDVQQHRLREMTSEILTGGEADISETTESLIGDLGRRQTDLQGQLVGQVRNFVSSHNRSKLRRLLDPEQGGP